MKRKGYARNQASWHFKPLLSLLLFNSCVVWALNSSAGPQPSQFSGGYGRSAFKSKLKSPDSMEAGVLVRGGSRELQWMSVNVRMHIKMSFFNAALLRWLQGLCNIKEALVKNTIVKKGQASEPPHVFKSDPKVVWKPAVQEKIAALLLFLPELWLSSPIHSCISMF